MTARCESPGTDPDAGFVYTWPSTVMCHEISALSSLEAITDSQLPKQGPGRTPHGNFVLTEIWRSPPAPVRLTRRPSPRPPALHLARRPRPTSRKTHSPPRALSTAIVQDGLGHSRRRSFGTWHVAPSFRFDRPVRLLVRTRLTIRLDQKYGGHHTLGRFRIQFGETLDDERPEAVRRQDHLTRKFNEWAAAESRTGRAAGHNSLPLSRRATCQR